MATTSFNAQQTSLLHLQTYNNHQINDILKPKDSISLNFPFNSCLTQLKYKHPKKTSTNALLKPFLKPLLSTPHDMAEVEGPMLFNGGWAQMVVSSGRADFRVWSRRRPGSKSKETRLIVTLECSVCLKNRYTTEKHKNLALRKAEKEKLILYLNTENLPNSEHQENNEFLSEKEKRRIKRQEEKRMVNAPNLLQLYKFCPKCQKHTLHKEIKVHK